MIPLWVHALRWSGIAVMAGLIVWAALDLGTDAAVLACVAATLAYLNGWGDGIQEALRGGRPRTGRRSDERRH